MAKVLRDAATDIRDAAIGIRDAAAGIRTLTGNLGTRIGTFMDNSEKTMTSFRANIADLGKAATTINRVAESAQGLLDENRGPLRDFSQSGLYEISQFIAEARVLVDSLTRLTNRIERDPTHFLFGDSQTGVKAQ